jgi:hypothetical protein
MSLSRSNVLVLIGAAVVLVGFLMPWFAINMGQELGRAMQGMQLQFNAPQMQGMPQMNVPMQSPIQTGTIYVSGGDVGKGIGWLVLALSAAVVALQWARTMTDDARRTVSLIVLGLKPA